MLRLLLFIFWMILFEQALGQVISSNPWTWVDEKTIQVQPENRRIIPKYYQTVRIQPKEMRSFLLQAPLWFTPEAQQRQVVLTLPMPDGSFQDFRIELAPVMHPELAARFPFIQSYAGIGINDPTAYLRCNMTQFGFHAMILSGEHPSVFIDPYSTEDDEHYIVYYKKDYSPEKNWECLVTEENRPLPKDKVGSGSVADRIVAGDCILRNFSLALACTGEYAIFHGGTVASAMAAMTTSLTRVNGVFEKDLSIHMDMVPNNHLLVFLDPANDPYTNNNGTLMLSQNQTTCDNIIGNANYDIGHVFSTGGGGVAYLGCVCNNPNKAGGVTGQAQPVGDPFDIDYVAHEMGHQFGANHTQNNNCNRVASAAFEPGSASTIMGYAGICPPNVQSNSDPYFHAHSLAEIAAEIASPGGGNTCSTNQTINQPPVVSPLSNFTIPRSTPFVLTASATDPNGDPLTYCWEQMNNQIATMPPQPTNTGGPTFRSLLPSASPSRYFPNLNAIINNQSPTWEVLPSVSRTLNFRVTVRDNKIGGGCTAERNNTVTVTAAAGPFLVTYPNTTGINIPALSAQTITWNVANTNAAPVNATSVDILLSTDGGLTYPTVLASATPNDGSETVTIPNLQTTQARIMVRGTGNIFFDISNHHFTISAPLNDFTLSVSPTQQSVCSPSDAQYNVSIGFLGSYSGNVTLEATGLPSGATGTFSINPMTTPGVSVLTISGLNNVSPGTYSITVNATGTTGTKSQTVTLVVANDSPAAVTLSSPANAATNVSLTPTLTWNSVAHAGAYELQVSTNTNFTSTVIHQTGLTSTSYAVTAPLNINTQYFWRVRGSNACGNGNWSTVFSFTTVNIVCTTFASTDVPKIIPATGTPTVTSNLPITVSGTIVDVNLVNLNITHTWINDLIVRVKSPANTERTMLSQICGSQDNIITNFDDEAPLNYNQLPCPPIQNLFYKPLQSLSAFDGQNLNGNWVLTVQDVSNQDGGSLNSWSLEICYVPSSTPLTVSALGSNVSCFGGNNGTATATATGGTPPYNYSWSNGGTTATITNLTAGTYTVTVTDNNGQTATASASVSQPSAALSVTVSGTNNTGNNNGTATATPAGGTPTYTYQWSNGATSSSISGLAGGTYIVTVTDANGCTVTGSVTIINLLSVVVSGTNVTCNNANNGTATANPSGGTGTYTYLWSNGKITQTISGLSPGTYTVTVTSGTQTATGSITITQPTSLSVTISKTNVACVGGTNGSATANPTGGTAPYSYAWSNGATTKTITQLQPGTYVVTVTDANGCTRTRSTTILLETTNISIAFTNTNPSCQGANNGTSKATPSGGVAPYTYLWNDGQTTQTAVGLAAGTYSVTVTDANGCTQSGTTTLTLPATPPFTIAFTATLPVCFGEASGTLKATPSGGVAPYAYLWSNGQTTQTAVGLAAGTYTVTVTDANGCTQSGSTTLQNPPQLVINSITSVPNGTRHNVTVHASGGTGTLRYRRSTGATTWSSWGTSNVFSNLNAGTYTFQVRDANLCTVSQTVAVPVSSPRPVSASVELLKNDTPHYDFTLSPNPCNGRVQVMVSLHDEVKGNIDVADVSGQIVLTNSMEWLRYHAGWIDLQHVPSGIYFVALRAEGQPPVVRKLVIQR